MTQGVEPHVPSAISTTSRARAPQVLLQRASALGLIATSTQGASSGSPSIQTIIAFLFHACTFGSCKALGLNLRTSLTIARLLCPMKKLLRSSRDCACVLSELRRRLHKNIFSHFAPNLFCDRVPSWLALLAVSCRVGVVGLTS